MKINRYVRTRLDHRRESAEDYCELISLFIAKTGKARLCDLSERLGITNVAVSKNLQKLERDGLVITKPYRSVQLTEAGEELAKAAHDTHRTVREFLQKIGVPEDIADADAEGIMHHVSQQTIDAMRSQLD